MKTFDVSQYSLEENHLKHLVNDLFVDVYEELRRLNNEFYSNTLDVESLTRRINLERIKKLV